VDGRGDLSNLPWHVTTNDLRIALKISNVNLINDLGAMALGVGALRTALWRAECRTGTASRRTRLIAAGTGLGEAALVWTTRLPRYLVGRGAFRFCPANDLEWELCRSLIQKFGRRATSGCFGTGLLNIYSF